VSSFVSPSVLFNFSFVFVFPFCVLAFVVSLTLVVAGFCGVTVHVVAIIIARCGRDDVAITRCGCGGSGNISWHRVLHEFRAIGPPNQKKIVRHEKLHPKKGVCICGGGGGVG
jgi:hypothetical protein